MKNYYLTLAIFVFFLTVFVDNGEAQTAVGERLFTVNDAGDSNDANVGDMACFDSNGKCTLRAAIQESNAFGFNVISFALPPASVINLTLGELLIEKPLSIVGPGARRLTVQRNPLIATPSFRIFHIAPDVSPRLVFRGFKVRNGNTDGDGGAFFIESGNTVFISEMSFDNNSAAHGGAIANAGILNLTRSLLNSNIATVSNGAGGAVMNIGSGSSAVVSDSTFVQNIGVNGGALYNQGNLLLVNNTLTQNSATAFGSNIVSAGSGTINVLNTIIGIVTSSTTTSLWGAFNSLGNNIVSDARNSTGFTNGVNNDQVSNDNSINPFLGNLADNGGQTDTLALMAGSPAIDNGNSCVKTATCSAPVPTGFRLNYDQRTGFSRQTGKSVDVGAFESGNTTISGSVTVVRFGFHPRLSSSIIILTNPETNEKIYRPANPFGNYRFSGLNFGGVYILEVRSKRAGLSSAILLELDGFPVPFLTDSVIEQEGLKFTLDK